MDDLAGALGKKTRLLAIGAASNALGTKSDVRRAADLAHAAGALVFVDAVHYAPHAFVDVAALGADFLACSAYKFYGPHVGVLWGRQALLEGLDLPKLEPAPENAPDRLETGTQNHEGIVGAAAAVDFLASLADGPNRRTRLATAMATLHERGQRLVEALWTGLRAIDGRHALRPAADGAADADGRVHGAGPDLGGRGAGPRRSRRVRLERRLLRHHGRPPPRPCRGRRRARGLRLLHDPRRGEPPRRRASRSWSPMRCRARLSIAAARARRRRPRACSAALFPQAAATPQEMHHLHGDPMAYIAALDDPARDAYQKPDEVMKALALRQGEVVADIGVGLGLLHAPLCPRRGRHGPRLRRGRQPGHDPAPQPPAA